MKLKFEKSSKGTPIWQLNLFEGLFIIINPRYWGIGISGNFIKSRQYAPEVHPVNVYVSIHILCMKINLLIANPKYDKQISNDYWKKKFSEHRKKDEEIKEELQKINSK